jgi:hypothetical protein
VGDLRKRLKALEKKSGIETLVCRVCGEELKTQEDVGLSLLVHDWLVGSGSEAEYPDISEDALAVDEHPCGWQNFVYKETGEPLLPSPKSNRGAH